MVSNLDVKDFIVTSFLGYKYRKQNDILYSVDAKTPRTLISMYYSEDVDRIDTSVINKRFVDRYIKNESAMENVHAQEEIEGLAIMYENMINTPFDEFEMFSILQMHRDLYSKCPFPEAGGKFRNRDVYLPGSGTETCNYAYIFDMMLSFEDVVNNLKRLAVYMKESGDYTNIFEYINSCVRLNCDLIKVHPFDDGNGRTIRCFTNKLFEEAGIPPVYITTAEKNDYARGLNLAINEGDYSEITAFYLYKICDSIIELDINKRVRAERNTESYDVKKKNKKKKNKKK